MLRVPLYLIPPPSKIIAYMVAKPGLLAQHTVPTLVEVLVGFLVGSIVGVALAAVIVNSPVIRRSIYPLLVAAQVVPKVAIAPLIMLWTGYGVTPKVVLAALICFFPVVIDVTHGLLAVEPEIQDLTRSLRASRWQVLTRVQLYASLPHLFASLKVASTLAVIGAIVGEFVGAKEGLGYLITVSNMQLDTPLMFSSIFILVLMGLGLFQAVAIGERWAIPWYHAAYRTE